MPEKYGQKVQPMQTTLRFKNDLSDSNAYINYKYLTNRNEIQEWERDPMRQIQIKKPSLYQGQNSSDFDMAYRGS